MPDSETLARALDESDGVTYRRRADGDQRLESGRADLAALLGLSEAPED